MTTLEETFKQFQQLPDWNKYPMPEVFYEHFKVAKPKPTNSIVESLYYSPPPSVSLNKNGKIEIRPPAPGGLREIKEFQSLPVEVKLLDDETGELKEYPLPLSKEEQEKKQTEFIEDLFTRTNKVEKVETLEMKLSTLSYTIGQI